MRIKHLSVVVGLAAAPALVPATVQAAPFCVVNGDAESFYFTVASGVSNRIGRILAPGETMCLVASDLTGTVSVFEDEAAMEGCTRLVEAGVTETLYRYSEFDRCAWSSNSDAPSE